MKSSNTEVKWTLLKVMAAVAALGVAVWYAASVWSQASAGPQPMTVQVALDNQCGLVDDAFVAVAEPDGTTAAFDKGVAVLRTRSDAKIMVRASAKYPDFGFESPWVKAAPQVRITTQCKSSGRIDRTLGSMREQFQPKAR